MQLQQHLADLESEKYLDNFGAGSPGQVRKAELTYLENRHKLKELEQKLENERTSTRTELQAVECEISDDHRNKLSVGRPAIVKVGEITLEGSISHISPWVANGTLSFTVVPDVSDHPGLRTGIQADVNILCDFRTDVIRIPLGPYYKYTKGNYYLWVYSEGSLPTNGHLGKGKPFGQTGRS